MHPSTVCDVARQRHHELRSAARVPGPAGPPRWATELAALALRRSMSVAERRARWLERDTARLAAALVDVEERARTARARLA